MSEKLFESLSTPEDWIFQVHPKANHAMWIAGHVALVDNSFISKFRPELAKKPEGWDELFWSKSQPTADVSRYPSSDEVLAYYRERRATLLRVLDELSEEELQGPAPPEGARSPLAGAPNMGHAFIFAAQHELMHAGQLTVAHRALGHAPLIG